MITKQYNGKRNKKQTQETKHNIAQNMFKVKKRQGKGQNFKK